MSQLLEALRTRQPIGNLAAVAHYSAMAVEAAAIKAPASARRASRALSQSVSAVTCARSPM